MEVKLYDGANCPCKAECERHGNCQACIEVHHAKKSLTSCERFYKEQNPGFIPEKNPLS